MTEGGRGETEGGVTCMRNNCGMIKRSRHEQVARWRAVPKARGNARKGKPERLTCERKKRSRQKETGGGGYITSNGREGHV